MSYPFFTSASRQLPLWRQILHQAARVIKTWFRNFINSLIEIVILFTTTAVLVGILLSFVEALSYIYLQTPIGIKYNADPSRSSVHPLTQLVQKDLLVFSVEIATAALAACLTISAICQILALRRYFHEGRGLLNRVFWLPLFSATAAYILWHTIWIDLQIAFAVMIIPCLCLYPACLDISNRLLPELTPFAIMEIIRRIRDARIHPADRLLAKPRNSLYPLTSDNLPTMAYKSLLSVKAKRKTPDSYEVTR